MRLLLLSLSITFGVISVASAKDADCMGEKNDAQFRACSKIIKSKTLHNKKINSENLAHVYVNRGQYFFYKKKLFDKAMIDFYQAILLDPNNTVAYIERGNVFNERKQYDRALTEYNQAIRLKTRFEHAYNGRGKSYYFKGQYNKAIADFDKAIRINPKYVNAYINRGHVFSNKKQYDRALINYNKAIRLDPKQANAYSSRAVIHSFKGEYNKAIIDLDQAIRLDSKNAKFYSDRGYIYVKKKFFKKAIAEYKQAIRLNPKSTVFYNDRGYSYNQLGLYDKAIADFDKANSLDPEYANPYNHRGYAFNQKGLFQKAIKDLNKAISLKPKYASAYNRRAWSNYKLGKLDQAQLDAKQAIQLDPKSKDYKKTLDDILSSKVAEKKVRPKSLTLTYINRGNSNSTKGLYDLAIMDYNKAIRLDPKNSDAYNNRANAYAFKGLYDQAIKDYNEAIRLDPKDGLVYSNRAFSYYKKGIFDQAIADCEMALRLKPKHAEAYYHRGLISSQKGLYDQAIMDYNEAIRLDPKDEEAYNDRGYAFNQKGLFEKAIKDLNKAISLKPKYASAYNRRAWSNYKLGKLDQAQLDAKQAIQLDPKSKDYKKTLDDILSSNVVVAEKKATKKEKTKVANLEKKQKAYRSTGKRIGLVVGNDKYQNLSANAQLQKAQNDARSTAETFTSLGFDVMRGFNLKRRDMNVQLTRLANKIEPGDEVMFFFAGHGVRIEGQNYLLPTDIPPISEANEDLLKSESLRVDRISEMFRKKGARLSVLILDACRDNPYKDTRGRSVGGTRGLAPMDPPEGTLVLFSAGAGQQALDRLSDDDKNPNSVFTRTFLPMIKQEGLELSRLSKLVKAKVRELAKTVGHNQTPAVYDEVIGDVFLAKQ